MILIIGLLFLVLAFFIIYGFIATWGDEINNRIVVRSMISLFAIVGIIIGSWWWMAWRISCSPKCIGENLMTRSFIGRDLSGLVFIESNMQRSDFSEANLASADLTGAHMTSANLRGADLHDAILIGADLILVDLRNANLTLADLRGADLSMADLTRLDLRQTRIKGAIFEESILVQ
ncbi:MAG: pentapeptide repeat-containing protein, partial [Chloroflexota bacterium]